MGGWVKSIFKHPARLVYLSLWNILWEHFVFTRNRDSAAKSPFHPTVWSPPIMIRYLLTSSVQPNNVDNKDNDYCNKYADHWN